MQDQGVEAEGAADGETGSVCGTPIYFVWLEYFKPKITFERG